MLEAHGSLPGMRSVELFAGAGGLALGCELAGFEPALTVEWDRWACDTIRENQRDGHPLVQGWKVHEGDVRAVDWSGFSDVSLVSGGPPCQPFSMGGKARGYNDSRDMFPATAEVIAKLRPKAFIVENVRGLTRPMFSNYFSYVQLRLRHPELVRRDGEGWLDHLGRLQAEHTTASSSGLRYNLVTTLVNAADYGVPQHRWRVFLVGFRSDLDAEFTFPQPTHSMDALFHDQWVTGVYWDRHKVATKDRPEFPERFRRRIDALRELDRTELPNAWTTVRDAIHGMPEPRLGGVKGWRNHALQPGARSYPGHTGSPLDEPAKTLKAGDHGVPGGENMLRRVDGSVRYFSIREAARLQTFPDDYELHGSWTEAMRQLGNAVPVKLAETVARSVFAHLLVAEARIPAAVPKLL